MRSRMLPRKLPSGSFAVSGVRGFTLVELVVVMMLMALITAVGASRFASREPFAAQAGADQIVSSLRVAQATAIAQRRSVYVVLAASPVSLAVCLDAGCTQPIAPPGGGAWLTDTNGLALDAGTSFSFDAVGAPSFAAALDVQLRSADGSASARPIRIEPVSGHVRLR